MSQAEYDMAMKHRLEKYASQSGSDSMLAKQTLIWSAKESIYKWYGEGLVDFRRHMILQEFKEDSITADQLLSFLLIKGAPVTLVVNGKMFGRLALAWISS
jgi:4'-phosphopantetheinyl transferase EntD